ncbi:MAG TPA: hypothetical protein VLV78_08580 [Thermoanaerobaculia bacterium]|nr:hypothetical protein [Thermoanaerobaculia bacterium]
MPPAILVLIICAIVALLVFSIVKVFAADRFDALAARLRQSSRLVSRGELVDGSRHHDVLLALTDSTFIYESSDGQSCFDRQWIQEVAYGDRLSTGTSVGGAKVLRLRCFSRTLEFVLSQQVFREWELVLPAQTAMTARA